MAERLLGQAGADFRINRGLFIQDSGAGTGPVGGIDLTPINRVDAGVGILKTEPDFEEVLRRGITAAKRVLRDQLPDSLMTADLETVAQERLIDYEESSLKRGTVMNKWAEALEIYEDLPESEMAFLNGSTVENSVLYMQAKMVQSTNGLEFVLPEEEIETLKATLPPAPKLRELEVHEVPEGEVDENPDQYSEEELADYKRDTRIYSDIAALTLLKALQDKLPADLKE